MAGIVVVGAHESPVGRAAAIELASRGLALALIAPRASDVESLADECHHRGASLVVALPGIPGVDRQFSHAFRLAAEHLGGAIEAVLHPVFVWAADAEVVSDDEFQRSLDRARTQVADVAAAALAHFKQRGQGRLFTVLDHPRTPVSATRISRAEASLRDLLDDLAHGLPSDAGVTLTVTPTADIQNAASNGGRR